MSLLKLVPAFHARPWGRRDLAPLYSFPQGQQDPIGEAWVTSLDCRTLRPGAREPGPALGDLWTQMRTPERGTKLGGLERFPLLIKFIFTADKLSIQVHPDDAYARAKENEPWGKTEMWHVLAAEPGGWVRVGARSGLDAERFRATLGKPEIEDALNHIPVEPGDTVYVPAGTVHAIGPGLTLCEIQQYSDLTYRTYDYDRPGLDGKPRTLHLDQARAVARHDLPQAGKVTPEPLDDRPNARLLKASPYFVTEKYAAGRRLELPRTPEHFDLLIILAGRGQVALDASAMDYAPGEAFLVMAGRGSVKVEPTERSEFLRVYYPPKA